MSAALTFQINLNDCTHVIGGINIFAADLHCFLKKAAMLCGQLHQYHIGFHIV